ncbi:DNA topoisomerase IB [Saccharomonospora cyanea]|uniref:DNA topoisomerase n=1 Tax=Saccharomonospora cyanea NA-134 TaxID=882082 RepID=H5XHH3_9PSEU|nr:topoisomerase IB [Saccharomonospora cyanea NA-134]
MVRLTRSDLSSPGVRRRRRGRGFEYRAPDGQPLRDPEALARIRSLAVPPAWRKVWICPSPDGHIQAVGYDDAGRRQYLYHSEWRRARDEEKHDRALALGKHLPEVRARIEADLAGRGFERRRILATALRMIDVGVFRVGSEEYAERNGSRGAATLLREHVRIHGDELLFRFPAKGGVDATVSLHDPALRRVLASLRRCRSGSDRLLVHRSADGWHEVRADEINERFKELAGEEFTVKDLRTWNATVLAAVAFGTMDVPRSQRAHKRAVASVMREVAEELGNTPAVARRSYVDPRVIRAFGEGTTIARSIRSVGSAGCLDEANRARLERAVIRMIQKIDR